MVKTQIKKVVNNKKWLAVTTLVFVSALSIFGVRCIFWSVPNQTKKKDTISILNQTDTSHPILAPVKTPRVVFHVGPPKTGTTTIQCSLKKLAHGEKLNKLGINVVELQSCRPGKVEQRIRMREYRAVFPNVKDTEFNTSQYSSMQKLTSYHTVVTGTSWLPACLGEFTKGNDLCWSESYLKYIHNYYKHGNITKFIFSNENIADVLSDRSVNTCRYLFDGILTSLGKEFEIDIVLTQRYLWEMMVSYFGEQYDSKFGVKPRLSKWPSKRGLIPPTMMQYILNESPINISGLITCLRYVADNNPRIHLKVINYHNEKPLFLDFLDTLSIEEPYASSLIGDVSSLVANVAKEKIVPFDRISIAAFKAELVPKNSSRINVGRAIKKYYKKVGMSVKDFVVTCPPAIITMQLLNTSIAVQKQVYPHLSQQTIEEKIVPQFEKAVRSNNFCDVNGTAMIIGNLFKNFLEDN